MRLILKYYIYVFFRNFSPKRWKIKGPDYDLILEQHANETIKEMITQPKFNLVSRLTTGLATSTSGRSRCSEKSYVEACL